MVTKYAYRFIYGHCCQKRGVFVDVALAGPHVSSPVLLYFTKKTPPRPDPKSAPPPPPERVFPPPYAAAGLSSYQFFLFDQAAASIRRVQAPLLHGWHDGWMSLAPLLPACASRGPSAIGQLLHPGGYVGGGRLNADPADL
jgi:hypothetical protein